MFWLFQYGLHTYQKTLKHVYTEGVLNPDNSFGKRPVECASSLFRGCLALDGVFTERKISLILSSASCSRGLVLLLNFGVYYL